MFKKINILLFLALFAVSAGAIPVSLDFSGSYVGSGDTDGLFNPGDPVSGSIVYDSESPVLVPHPIFGAYNDAISVVNLGIGGQTFGLNEPPTPIDGYSPPTNQIFVSNVDEPASGDPGDVLGFIAQIEQSIFGEPLFLRVVLRDPDATALTSTALPTALSPFDELLVVSAGLAVFEPIDDINGLFNTKFDFSLDSLTLGPVASVPEPGSMLLLLIGMVLLLSLRGFNAKRGQA